MRKKADPGNLGNPVHGMWPYRHDPPLYWRRPGDDKNKRSHTGLASDFWGAPIDVAEIGYEALYPAPNAWVRTRAPFALGNVPEVSEIMKGNRGLTDPYSGTPISYQYHGNNFLIDGPYGDSGDAQADTFFYNNLVPIPRGKVIYPAEKMLRDRRRKKKINWYHGVPTLPMFPRRRRTNMWDWLGPARGGNAPPSYGTEPQTGGGGAGLIRSFDEVDNMQKEASQQNPETLSDIEGLVEKIKRHRGSLDYNTFSLLIEPLVDASRKYQFKYLCIVGLAKKIRTLSKKIGRNTDGRKTKKYERQVKEVVNEILDRIRSRSRENTKTASSQALDNWYERFLNSK